MCKSPRGGGTNTPLHPRRPATTLGLDRPVTPLAVPATASGLTSTLPFALSLPNRRGGPRTGPWGRERRRQNGEAGRPTGSAGRNQTSAGGPPHQLHAAATGLRAGETGVPLARPAGRFLLTPSMVGTALKSRACLHR